MKACLAAPLLALLCLHAQAFDLQGHRGARGLAPENTLPGFARALGIGVTTLETDIAVSRDGVLLISHDPALNPDITRGAGRPVPERTRAGDLAHRPRRAAALRRRPPEAGHALGRRSIPEQKPTTARACPGWRSCSRW